MQERESTPEDVGYCWPESLFNMQYDPAVREIERQFGSVYLPRKLEEAGENRTQAAKRMGLTPKTLRQKLRDSGLGQPSLVIQRLFCPCQGNPARNASLN